MQLLNFQLLLLQAESIPTLEEKFDTWVKAIQMLLPEIGLAIVILILVFLLSRYVSKLTMRFYKRRSDNPAIATVMASMFSFIFIIIGIFIALSILGLNQTVTSLLAGAGILGLVLGLALQDTLASAVAGIIMTQRKSYKVGDFVQSNDFVGTITEINLRNTTIRQTIGVEVKIPNKLVLSTPLINYSLTKERRVDITIGIAYESDLKIIPPVISSAISENVSEYNPQKPIEVFFTSMQGNNITVLVRFWIKKYRQADFYLAQSQAIEAIKQVLESNNIHMPNPTYLVELKNNAALTKDN